MCVMAVHVITKENFETEVLQSEQTVLVDFWASWCGPCSMFAPVVEQIAEEHAEIKVGKVNVEEQPELAQQFQVMSIPMMVVFKGGKAVGSSVGVQPKEAILALAKKAM